MSTAVEGRLIVVEVTLVAKPSLVDIKTDSGARVTVDGRPAGSAPFAQPLALDAGKHVITITARGRMPWVKEVELKRGDRISLDVDLSSTTQRKLSYWVFGASAATLATAGILGATAFSADSDASDLDQKRRSEGLTPAELTQYNQLVDRRDSRKKLTYVFLGVGATVGAAGVLMLLLDNPTPEAADFTSPQKVSTKRSPLSVVPMITPGVTGLAATGTF